MPLHPPSIRTRSCITYRALSLDLEDGSTFVSTLDVHDLCIWQAPNLMERESKKIALEMYSMNESVIFFPIEKKEKMEKKKKWKIYENGLVNGQRRRTFKPISNIADISEPLQIAWNGVESDKESREKNSRDTGDWSNENTTFN